MIPPNLPTRRFSRHAAATRAPWPANAWRRELARSVTTLAELRQLLDLPEALGDAVASGNFPLKVPRPYIARMRRGDAGDPLLRQVLPSLREADKRIGFQRDALAEAEAMVDTGLMQKYAGRALLIATGTCAVNCRYCFRRHFPYEAHRQDSTFPGLAAVRRDTAISEVILSGGDPLMLTDTHFARLVEQIAVIGHVTRIRIHTRTPVVVPQRVTAALIDTLARVRQRIVVVLHFNHPNELDDDCRRAISALDEFTLLNQSVLLRDVNDDADTLARLSEQLFDAGTLPYYLHLPGSRRGHRPLRRSRGAGGGHPPEIGRATTGLSGPETGARNARRRRQGSDLLLKKPAPFGGAIAHGPSAPSSAHVAARLNLAQTQCPSSR